MIDALTFHHLLEREGIPIIGCAYHPNRVNYAPEATAEQRALGDALAVAFNTLTVNVSKSTLIADGVDVVVITCDELLTNMDYTFWRDDVLVSSGSVAEGSIEYLTNVPGALLFEIREPGGYLTGYVEVNAQ